MFELNGYFYIYFGQHEWSLTVCYIHFCVSLMPMKNSTFLITQHKLQYTNIGQKDSDLCPHGPPILPAATLIYLFKDP